MKNITDSPSLVVSWKYPIKLHHILNEKQFVEVQPDDSRQ